MKQFLRAATLAIAGMGMTYVLFIICGPYWSHVAASNTVPKRPKTNVTNHLDTGIHYSVDEFSDWVKAAPKGEVREAIVNPDGTFILKSRINNARYEVSELQGMFQMAPKDY